MKQPLRKAAGVVDGAHRSPHDSRQHRSAFSCQVVQSTEALDLDGWLDRYVRAIASAKSASLAA